MDIDFSVSSYVVRHYQETHQAEWHRWFHGPPRTPRPMVVFWLDFNGVSFLVDFIYCFFLGGNWWWLFWWILWWFFVSILWWLYGILVFSFKWYFWLNWIDLIWIGLNWTELIWIELNWFELNWMELNWLIDLIWIELIWFELIWIELSWTDWFDLSWVDLIWLVELNWLIYYDLFKYLFICRLRLSFAWKCGRAQSFLWEKNM